MMPLTLTEWTTAAPTIAASFLASMVEFVEALTIVLAVGLTRGWRWALLGTVAGLALLVGLVAALGSSLQAVPLHVLQLLVGVLLLMFGLRWLHKAVLRGAGVLPLHDEAGIFARQSQQLRAGAAGAWAFDTVAFVTTFKTVLLEGIEVVFVVVALSVRPGLLLPASAGAALAMLVVAALGLALHRPLARVPENALKFSVGAMLAAFGTYWAGEGIGLAWPGQDLVILFLIAAFALLGLGLVKACARLGGAPVGAAGGPGVKKAAPSPGAFALVGGELLGLFVEDGWLAAGILGWVAGAAELQARHAPPAAAGCAIFAAGLAAVLAASALRRASAGAALASPPMPGAAAE